MFRFQNRRRGDRAGVRQQAYFFSDRHCEKYEYAYRRLAGSGVYVFHQRYAADIHVKRVFLIGAV